MESFGLWTRTLCPLALLLLFKFPDADAFQSCILKNGLPGSPSLLGRTRRLPVLQSAVAEEVQLTDDGGVVKTILEKGDEETSLERGSIAVVKYQAAVRDGKTFAAGEEYRTTVRDGTMIQGWDIALESMKIGEKAKISLAPEYAYGEEGVAPVIEPNSPVDIELEVLAYEGNILNPATFADNNPLTPRTPQAITAAFESTARRQAREEAELEGLEGFAKFEKWYRSLYFFGLFGEGQTGEKPPILLNPFITFPAIFLVVGVAFYIVFVSGGVITERAAESVLDDASLSSIFKTVNDYMMV
uniref:peptidylprolyl isomerase n=1 Tax=Fibrocapsa japonica TaxID=94617 RepID=A0A7S2UWP8_9STRA|mmetsp:Transcript_13804/g.20336  ORF Transcript_13804/g.20336 Transcript_13804/m.20336 type:complete len:301 (+) Transcript_13804:32-934(+)